MPRRIRLLATGLMLACVAIGGCTSGRPPVSGRPVLPALWAPFRHVPGVVDLAGPRTDGSLTVAAAGRLFLLGGDGALRPFARGPGGYSTATGPEPYIAVTGDDPVPGTGCSFRRDTTYAIEPGPRPGIIQVDPQGRARRYASLPGGAALSGIAFDATGRFGHRLLVTAGRHGVTTLSGIDCRGRVTTVAAHGPPVEGGIAVAPPSFGRFAGDLIAPDETHGGVFAFQPDGHVVTLVQSGLPSGGDIGVESAGFVPPGFGPAGAAYLADRFSAGNAHPGTNSILRIGGADLAEAGVRPGDLLVATEGGTQTIAIRCGTSCAVRPIAQGPAPAHGEGHIAVVASRAPGG
ncbi:MAG TPA: hypothetical protein VGN41_08000 [Streptosporangiaceae bacterium]